MSGGGSSGNTTTTVQNSAPWSAAQPYLQQIMGGAQSAYQSGNGFAPYPGSTVAPFSSQTNAALAGITNAAQAGNPLGTASQNATLGILNNNGQTPESASAATGLQGLLGQGSTPSAIADNLTPYANGSYVNGGSPQFLASLNTQSNQLTDDVNREWSNAGRYGSAGQANDVAQQVGNLQNTAIAGEIQREQGQQIQAAGLLSGEQQQGIGNQVGILGDEASLGNQGASNLATFTGLAPSVYSQQYAPYQELAGAGSAYDTQAQNTLTGQVNQYTQTQQEPWNLLNAYAGILSGSGSQGTSSTSSQTAPQPSALQGILSGGLLGAQIGSAIPGIGTLIGGGVGALAGLL